jgi:NADPH:quinone reductase
MAVRPRSRGRRHGPGDRTWRHRPGARAAGCAFTRGGGLAEIAVADAALTAAFPDGVALPVAAAAPLMLSTAWLLLAEVTRARSGESLLMHSASGGIGSAVAQIAKQLGMGVSIGTASRPEKAAGRCATAGSTPSSATSGSPSQYGPPPAATST